MRFRLTLPPLALLMAAAFTMDMSARGGGQAFQEAGLSLGASPLQLGLLGTAFSLCYSATCILAGKRSDTIGRRASTLIATVGFALVYLVAGHLRNIHLLLIATGLRGALMAFFWPALQAWIGEIGGHGRRALGRNLGLFNFCWSLGIMSGPALVGYLWAHEAGGAGSQRLVFWVLAALSAAIAAVVTLIGSPARNLPGRESPGSQALAAPPRAQSMLWAARIGLFAGYFCGGIVGSLFPKLGQTLGYDEELRGLLVSSYHGGQVIMFGLTLFTSRWQMRRWPLATASVVGVLAMLLTLRAQQPRDFALVFAVTGAASAVAYATSLFHSLHGRTSDRGRFAGVHEAILSGAVFLGPLLGGIFAQYVSLRAPYALGACVFAAGLCLQWVVWSKAKAATKSGEGRPLRDQGFRNPRG